MRAGLLRLTAAGDDCVEEGMVLTEENAELALQHIRNVSEDALLVMPCA